MSPRFSEGPTNGETITLVPSSNDNSEKSSQTTYGVAGGSPSKLEQGEIMTEDEEWCKDFESNTGNFNVFPSVTFLFFLLLFSVALKGMAHTHIDKIPSAIPQYRFFCFSIIH